MEIIKTDGNVEIVQGIGKESGKPYTALRVVLGDWKSKLIFPKSNFEWKYISDYLGIDNPVEK